MTISTSHKMPESSIVMGDISANADYVDSFSLEYEPVREFSIDYLTALMFLREPPAWMKKLFQLRDWFVTLFGLKTGLGEDEKTFDENVKFSIGEKVGFFPVLMRTDNEIVLAETDKHLSFWVSVLKRKHDEKSMELSITTLVRYENLWGRIYFIPVKPFHKIIVKKMLVSISKDLVC